MIRRRSFLGALVAGLLLALPALAAGPWYVYSGAAGTADGLSWVNAKTTLAAAATASSAGDAVYVANDHAESQAGAMTITFPGTNAAPNLVFCANRAGTVPPVTADLCTSASITTTGSVSLAITGAFYIRGIAFTAGGGGSAVALLNLLGSAGGGAQTFEKCSFGTTNNSASANFTVGSASTSNTTARINFINSSFSFGATGQNINLQGSPVTWRNNVGETTGAGVTGATIPTSLFSTAGLAGSLVVDGVDLSALGSGKNLVNVGTDRASRFVFSNVKLGASVAATTGTNGGGPMVDLQVADSGTKNYRQEGYRFQGSFVDEETIVLTTGWSDGTTPWSYKVATNANPSISNPLEVLLPPQWVDSTGSHTATVELNSSGTLNNNDAWLELRYLGDASFPDSTADISTRIANLLPSTSSAALTSSAASWASDPATPVHQKLVATVTVNMKGWVRPVLKVAKASTTLYANSAPTMVP